MINHARTLLLNTTGPHLPSKTVAGDEYIPAYAAISLNTNLKLVCDILYGSNPDYRGKVYRVTEFMKVLHASGYDSYIYDLDPRVTYNTSSITAAIDGTANFTPEYFATTVTGGRQFGVTGTWEEAGYDGRVSHSWIITALNASTIYIQNKLTGAVATYALTDVKVLPGSDLRLTANTAALTPGAEWIIDYKARPQPSLGVILASLHVIPIQAIQAVFGLAERAEPFTTFYNLFMKNDALPQQLAGFLLALIYKIEAMRLEE